MQMQNLGTITTTIALAVFNQNLPALREALSEAWNFYETTEAEAAINRALSPLPGSCKLWFKDAIVAIQSGSEDLD